MKQIVKQLNQDPEQLRSMLQRFPTKLKGADDITLRGFVQCPRVVLFSKSLSDGDKITHLLLLSFAWQHPTCFPSQGSLGAMRGKTDRQMRRNLASLRQNGFIKVVQNGSARANTYEILCRVAKGGQVIVPPRSDGFDIEFQDGDDFSIGGFVQVPVALLEDTDLSDGAILTYSVLADQGTRAPSQQVMAEQRGIRRPAFNSQVNELVKMGYLHVRKEGWGSTLTYVRRLKFVKRTK
jgi:DNA-binding MarR family transcriptional regulator